MPKKVLLATRPLTPPWDEASKNFAYFLGREVRNHELTLLTTKEPLDGLPETAKQETIFTTHHFNVRAKWNLLRYLRSVRDTFDITHYLFTPTKQNTSLIKQFAFPRRGKTLQTIAVLRDDIHTNTELRSMLFADMLITYTHRTEKKLQTLGFANVRCIYPGIDLTRFRPQEKSNMLLKAFDLDKGHFIVMYPGEYVRLGATDMITDALIQFFSQNPETNIRFVFACRVKNEADARKKEEVKQRFADANILGYITFSDTVSDMPALYNTADIIIFPVSDLNGKFDIPLVIIEAYACGKPVILSDLPAFEEFSNDDICVTIPKNSSTALIESISNLKEDSSLRSHITHEARLYVEKYFDVRDTAKQYEEIYSSLK